MLFLLSLLSTAQKDSIKGLRVNACVGLASYCPMILTRIGI